MPVTPQDITYKTNTASAEAQTRNNSCLGKGICIGGKKKRGGGVEMPPIWPPSCANQAVTNIAKMNFKNILQADEYSKYDNKAFGGSRRKKTRKTIKRNTKRYNKKYRTRRRRYRK